LTSVSNGPRQITTTMRPIGEVPDPTVDGMGPTVAALHRRRNLSGAALGVLLVSVCALAIGTWASTVGHRTQVLVVTRAVPAGSVIQAADLTTAGVAADHRVAAIPASAEYQEVGKVASVGLVPGSLLERSQVGTGPAIRQGTSVVGLDLKGGAFPAEMAVGATVEVVSTPSQGASATAGTVLAASSTVLSMASDLTGAGTLISVAVPVGEAPSVTSAGAGEGVSLVMIPGAGG
jgi:SAF domain